MSLPNSVDHVEDIPVHALDRHHGASFTRGYAYHDVMLRPQKTDLSPDEVDLSTQCVPSVRLGLPVMSSPMTSVTSPALAIALAQAGALGVLHRLRPIQEQMQAIDSVKHQHVEKSTPYAPLVDASGRYLCAAAIGADDVERAIALEAHGADLLMMDCAQPYHTAIMRKFEALRRAVAIPIVAGTVATREAAVAYCNLGASALRIGLGPGSVCTTSTLTGIGVPQISAIMDIASETTRIGVPLIADGGISSGGDILKALAAGADAVMIGRLFAGSTEAPSDVVMHNGRQYKKYQASKYESVELQYPTQWDAVDAYLQSEPVDDFRVEGIGGLIPHTGPVHMTVIQLERALRLGLGFMGAANIHALRQRAEFIVTSRVNGAQRTDAAMVVTEKSRQFS